MCLKAKCDYWYLDSGCSKHMTDDKTKFTKFIPKNKRFVTYGDNNKGRILGIGQIGKPSSITIDNVLYVEGLKHNLLSISQLSNKSYNVIFNSSCCIVENKNSDTKLIGRRVNNIYMITLDDIFHNLKCLMCNNDDA